MLFFIETGILWCMLYSSNDIYTCIKYPLPGLVKFFVYNDSRVSLSLLYIIIDECLLLLC